MRKLALLLAACFCAVVFASGAKAQAPMFLCTTIYNSVTGAFSCVPVGQTGPGGGTNALPVSGTLTQAPYAYTPLTPGQHNLGIVASTALTVPTGATYATVCVSGAAAKYTTDGTTTPTAGVGQPLLQSACVSLSGATVLANFRAIQQAATATLDVEYFK